MSRPTNVVLLGSTGSIGTQALEVVRDHPDDYRVVALAAGSNADVLQAQATEFGVPAERARLAAETPEVLAELAALDDADVVLNAVVGFAGLPATLAALAHEIVPVDSEHSAVYQALRAGRASEVARIVLTASGGPFRGRTRAELAQVTVADALAHPTWTMGPKITIDSSTLMNKGLEVIEAHELFGVDFDRIEVVVHPQSVVHGMVEFTDGATIAQLSMPDMRLPIGLALGAPHRLDQAFGAIDWPTLGTLTFEAADPDAFPCLGLAYAAGRAGGGAPATLSGANEVAVEAFLDGRIPWLGIAETVDEVLQAGTGNVEDVSDVLETDRVARERARRAIANRAAA
jgi:1-deoxy-D-xylulose-5-phosphate reductoisomerase